MPENLFDDPTKRGLAWWAKRSLDLAGLDAKSFEELTGFSRTTMTRILDSSTDRKNWSSVDDALDAAMRHDTMVQAGVHWPGVAAIRAGVAGVELFDTFRRLDGADRELLTAVARWLETRSP